MRQVSYVLPLAVVCLHPILNAVFKSQAQLISYLAFVAISVAAIWHCSRRFADCPPKMRRNWGLLLAGISLWCTATVLAAWADLVQHVSVSAANIDDFFYFFYGVPILLVIVAPDEGEKHSLFFWLDGIQAAAVGYLAYSVLYTALPFTHAPTQPISVVRLVWIYDVEDFSLAAIAALRLIVSIKNSPDRQFFRMLTTYLWVYAICASVYNHLFAVYASAGPSDVVPDLPFLYLALAAGFFQFSADSNVPGPRRNAFALFTNNARPVVLGLALVALSLLVGRQHFALATGMILGAFVIYGMRSAVLQNHLLEAQQELEQARDRLEQLALMDGLTGVANRRCFDQRFELEWNRAHRAKSALSLLLIDIDRFKALNDTYGHLMGDECLIQVAKTLERVLNRSSDLFARYGGEEFVVLLPETDARGARNVAERLQSTLAQTSPIGNIEHQVTLSIGGTTWTGQRDAGAEAFMEAADRALYQAKQNGRNRIEYVSLDAAGTGEA